MYTPELLAYPYNLASALPREREETVAYLKRAARFCAAIECPGMLVSCDHPGYGRNASEAWGDLVSGLREVCREADALGVSVSMESLGPNTSPIVSRADDLARLIADVGVPSFGAMLDMAIPPLAAEPMSEYLDKLGGGCAMYTSAAATASMRPTSRSRPGAGRSPLRASSRC